MKEMDIGEVEVKVTYCTTSLNVCSDVPTVLQAAAVTVTPCCSHDRRLLLAFRDSS